MPASSEVVGAYHVPPAQRPSVASSRHAETNREAASLRTLRQSSVWQSHTCSSPIVNVGKMRTTPQFEDVLAGGSATEDAGPFELERELHRLRLPQHDERRE